MTTKKNNTDASGSTNTVARVHDAHAGSSATHAHGHHARQDGGTAFLSDPYEGGAAISNEDLAELSAEEYLSAATSGEPVDADELDETEQLVERGGPFIETTGREEFAKGYDKSNPKGASREAFPTAVHGPKK